MKQFSNPHLNTSTKPRGI